VHTAEAVSSSSTPDLSSATESAKDAASDLKSKAKSVLRGSSAVPNSTATLADLNADVRNEASDYRDPAIATPQDKLAGGVSVGWGGQSRAVPNSNARVLSICIQPVWDFPNW